MHNWRLLLFGFLAVLGTTSSFSERSVDGRQECYERLSLSTERVSSYGNIPYKIGSETYNRLNQKDQTSGLRREAFSGSRLVTYERGPNREQRSLVRDVSNRDRVRSNREREDRDTSIDSNRIIFTRDTRELRPNVSVRKINRDVPFAPHTKQESRFEERSAENRQLREQQRKDIRRTRDTPKREIEATRNVNFQNYRQNTESRRTREEVNGFNSEQRNQVAATNVLQNRALVERNMRSRNAQTRQERGDSNRRSRSVEVREFRLSNQRSDERRIQFAVRETRIMRSIRDSNDENSRVRNVELIRESRRDTTDLESRNLNERSQDRGQSRQYERITDNRNRQMILSRNTRLERENLNVRSRNERDSSEDRRLTRSIESRNSRTQILSTRSMRSLESNDDVQRDTRTQVETNNRFRQSQRQRVTNDRIMEIRRDDRPTRNTERRSLNERHQDLQSTRNQIRNSQTTTENLKESRSNRIIRSESISSHRYGDNLSRSRNMETRIRENARYFDRREIRSRTERVTNDRHLTSRLDVRGERNPQGERIETRHDTRLASERMNAIRKNNNLLPERNDMSRKSDIRMKHPLENDKIRKEVAREKHAIRFNERNLENTARMYSRSNDLADIHVKTQNVYANCLIYVFYVLQGIYLSSLLIQVLGEKKVSRYSNWLKPAEKYIKVE